MDVIEKKPVQVLRERQGGISDRLKADYKQQIQIHKAIKEALKNGPRTIPDIAEAAQLPADSVMWHVIALQRYGVIARQQAAGDYYLFALMEEK